MSVKTCCNCELEKLLCDFGKDSSSNDGLSYKCKICRNEYSRDRPKNTVIFTCKSCNKTKDVRPESLKRNKTGFCNNCYSIAVQKNIRRPQFSGVNSGRWNGGEYMSSDGYKMIKVDNRYSKSGRQIYKKEHILVYEKYIGRELLTEKGGNGESIHHINGDKLDNRIENLVLCNGLDEHMGYHCQLEKVAYEFVKLGKIKFNIESKTYYAAE